MKNKVDEKTQSRYSKKKQRMQNGTYIGDSPFYQNIAEFQHLLPIESYPHLRVYNLKKQYA